MAERRRTHRFGPFTFEHDEARLRQDGKVVELPIQFRRTLGGLLEEPGVCVPVDRLIEAGWGAAKTDATLYKVIAELRRLFDPYATERISIENLRPNGYRFLLPCVEVTEESASASATDAHSPRALTAAADTATPDARLDPDSATVAHAAVRRGRAALETLALPGVQLARDAFASIALTELDGVGVADVHAGVAATFWLQFESTRADRVPDRESLRLAFDHVLEAARQNPSSPLAWAMLALVRHRRGQFVEAIDAAAHAVTLAGRDWRVHVVLAFVSSGAKRLEAALAALRLTPDNPIALWLAATVYIARRAFGLALDCIITGCRMQDLQLLYHDRHEAMPS